MKPKDKVIHNGIAWYSVAATARLLGVTKAQVKEFMGGGELEWTQVKADGPLYVAAHSIARHSRWKGG